MSLARAPVISSFLDAGYNVGMAANWGWDLPTRKTNPTMVPPTRLGSVGGMMTAFGGAGAGALVGAALGSQMEGNMVGPAALTGAAIGAAAVPAAGLAMRAGYEVGAAGLRLGMTAAQAAPGAVSAAWTGAAPVASAAIAKYASAGLGYASKLVRWDLDTPSLGSMAEQQSILGKMTNSGGVKMTGLGKSALLGGSLMVGAAGAFNQLNKNRMGTMDGRVTTATPRASYGQNAGATGDLVFALNRLRRG